MAFSIQRAVSDGTMTRLPISIKYFDREEISVLFNGVLNARQWAWVGTTDKTLSFTPAVNNAVEVMIVRKTDLSQLRHQFSLGVQFTAESLDESLIQVMHIAQEAKEQLQGTDFYNDLDLHRYKIANVAPGVNPGDAVNKSQMDAHGTKLLGYTDAAAASAAAAAASAKGALASENKANEWAEKTSGPVEGSEYSAKYWAEQAAASTSGQFYEGSNTVTVNKTIVNGKNAMTPGPITVANGPSVVVESGAVWTIV